MAEGLVLVDTNIFIAAFRGDGKIKKILAGLGNQIVISTITELELYRGAKTASRKDALKKQLEVYAIAPLTEEISSLAVQIMYESISGHQDVFVADCLIAATAKYLNLPLLTLNGKDFQFIKGLELYPLD